MLQRFSTAPSKHSKSPKIATLWITAILKHAKRIARPRTVQSSVGRHYLQHELGGVRAATERFSAVAMGDDDAAFACEGTFW